MISIDTNVLIAIVNGDNQSEVVRHVLKVLEQKPVYIPCIAVTEFFSTPNPLSEHTVEFVNQLIILPVREGLWRRAGLLRAAVLRTGLKCLTADALIAQQAIEAGLQLGTLDTDFRHFVPHGLQLVDS